MTTFKQKYRAVDEWLRDPRHFLLTIAIALLVIVAVLTRINPMICSPKSAHWLLVECETQDWWHKQQAEKERQERQLYEELRLKYE